MSDPKEDEFEAALESLGALAVPMTKDGHEYTIKRFRTTDEVLKILRNEDDDAGRS